jgi:CPA2 family monovalent cation:H+ antiporter-2
MEFHSPLIGVLVIGLGLAFVLGTLAQRLKLPPLVGYLLAGIAVGPFTPGFVADTDITLQLADIGVVLLMFGVGLHFAPRDLLAVKKLVVPGALAQMAMITLLGVAAGLLMGWPWRQGLVLGLCLSVASTVVVMRALEDRRLTETEPGRIATGWLVVQDLATVLVLVVLPPLAGLLKGEPLQLMALGQSLLFTFGKLGIFALLLFLVGAKFIPAMLHYIAHTGSRELFRLAVLSVALGVAFIAAQLFGVSIALGAFFAGMILSGSPLSQRAAEESLPLRDAFAVLFFLSVGMLFDPHVLTSQAGGLALAFGVVLAGGGAAYLLLRLMGVEHTRALVIAVSLAQVGEFSFILADLSIGLGILNASARGLVLGASILSILVNPLLFAFAARGITHPKPGPKAQPAIAPEPTKLAGHAVVVGYGRVGRLLVAGLKDRMPLLVIEDTAIGEIGVEHIRGNAARDDVLEAANIAGARLLLVAIPQAFEAGQIVEKARKANPALRIVARAHFDAEVDHLEAHGANYVVMGEREIAHAILDFVAPY